VKPNFAIVSNWNGPGFEDIAELTIPNRIEYARRHGYIERMHNFPDHYGKISALLENWKAAAWLWWLDVDAVITNPSIRLEDLAGEDSDVVVACDSHGINTGSILIRTTKSTRKILEAIRRLRSTYERGPWHDQNGFAYQLWTIADRVKVVPKRRLNSYPDDWRPGDFVLHCPGRSNPIRRKILERALIRLERSAVVQN
jgi:hypothetical protein